MEIFLNRWSGTGRLFNFLPINGKLLYALYIGILFGLISSWYIGLLSIGLFYIARSKGYGKWVGALCEPKTKTDLQKEYDDLEGYNFPFIHQISNFFIKERENFFNYCKLALGLRGLYWGLVLYIGLFLHETINLVEYLTISLAYAIGFPFGCWLSTKKSFNFKNRFISIVGRWETQEVYYGAIHMICNMYLIFKITGVLNGY